MFTLIKDFDISTLEPTPKVYIKHFGPREEQVEFNVFYITKYPFPESQLWASTTVYYHNDKVHEKYRDAVEQLEQYGYMAHFPRSMKIPKALQKYRLVSYEKPIKYSIDQLTLHRQPCDLCSHFNNRSNHVYFKFATGKYGSMVGTCDQSKGKYYVLNTYKQVTLDEFRGVQQDDGSDHEEDTTDTETASLEEGSEDDYWFTDDPGDIPFIAPKKQFISKVAKLKKSKLNKDQ